MVAEKQHQKPTTQKIWKGFFLSRDSIRKHAERDIVLPFLSVCPIPVLCWNDCSLQTFSTVWYGPSLVYVDGHVKPYSLTHPFWLEPDINKQPKYLLAVTLSLKWCHRDVIVMSCQAGITFCWNKWKLVNSKLNAQKSSGSRIVI